LSLLDPFTRGLAQEKLIYTYKKKQILIDLVVFILYY